MRNKNKIEFVLQRMNQLSKSESRLRRPTGSVISSIDLDLLQSHPLTSQDVEEGSELYRLLLRQYYLWKDKRDPNSPHSHQVRLNDQKLSALHKKEVSHLYSYFKSLANEEGRLDIASFNKAFEGKDYMQRITASLFSYLDKKGKGSITFEDFFTCFYPNITDRNQLRQITQWAEQVDSYSEDFSRFLKHGKTVKMKPRVPEAGLKQLKKSFDRYDTAGEGCNYNLIQTSISTTLKTSTQTS